MEHQEILEASSVENAPTEQFTFSRPNIVHSPKVTNFGSGTIEQVFDPSTSSNALFTFAAPVSLSQSDFECGSIDQTETSETQYKPRISRNAYKPSINVFAQALKDTAVFEQLKKNSRAQAPKVNVENSITCTNVPQTLLKKVAAKEYFTSFGNTLKIAIRPKKQVICVIYATKQEANVAYSKCGVYLGEKFTVEWTKLCMSSKSLTKKDLQKNVVSNLIKMPEDEVKEELNLMMDLEYNLHSDAKDIVETSSLQKNKALHSKSSSKPSLRTEKAGAKMEKQKADSQISDLLPNTSAEELQNIIRQAAFTSEDKYKVLEARDRLMRLQQVKLHTLAAAKVMSGTCPDMCPEKERLMRESTRQVALYEQLEHSEYRINHAKAVKQYSRSSADQEEPMAHDLRPVKSLKMTMSYLLHEIANLCDQPGTNLGDWYHFLWDRTRGIRKDITQQELCCVESVELVEQCARFHIVCSERLCAEESAVFDKRINSDNLTKCLQSLKYMYHDLRVKGIACRNEPEFRAYIILLNVNNGNFMSDLQKLPITIQKSGEVQFAIEVYSALESNNYCKFFMLVRKTTYLNACILLRYFNQVRIKALSVMVKAYCRTTSTAYPLYELIDILGFEDENEAIYFCEQIGLNASRDELHVLLNRQNFTQPVLNIKQNRACNMIESKRTTLQLSIGQCIAGGKMPEKCYNHHKPHNSFDSQGYLLPESINAENQSNAAPTQIDPYKFVEEEEEEDVSTSHNLPWTPEINQTKMETTTATEYTELFEPVTTVESHENVFLPVKSNTEIRCTSKPLLENTYNGEPQGSNVSKTVKEKQFDQKIPVFNLKEQDNIFSTNKHSDTSIFGKTVNTTISTTSNTVDTFPKQIEVAQSSEIGSLFAMPTSKSIFSENIQGNIFARNVIPSSVFNSSPSNVQISSNPFSATTTTNAILKGTGSSCAPEELPRKQLQGTTDTEKLISEEIESSKKLQQINDNAEQILNQVQAEVVMACCSSIVSEEINRIKIYNQLTQEVNDQIFNEITYNMCNDILEEEIANKQRLEEILRKIKNRVILRCFNRWKQYTFKRRQQREALANTPVWLQRRSVEQCAKSLYSKEQNLVVQNMCKRQVEQDFNKSYIESLAPIEIIISAGIKENLKSLDIDNYPNFYWKLIISWPDLQNKPILWHHKKIINQYLSPDNYTMEPIIKVYRPNQFGTLHICIRHFEGLIGDHNLIGSDALLFIAAASEETQSISRRLTKTILSRHKLMPIPLVFIVLGERSLKMQNREIVSDLEDLLESGYLSEYTVMYERDVTEKTILTLTQSAVLWLSVNRSPPNPLEMDFLQDIFDTCLTEELWLRILGDSSFNVKLSYAVKEPNFIINLHNEAVTHLMDIILDPESLMYTNFAPEFKKFLKKEYMMPCSYEFFDHTWKAEDYKVKLENVMSTFILPQWKYSWPIINADALRQSIMHYCQEALSDSNSNVICNILSNLFLTSDTSTISNFIDILLYVVKEKISFSENLKVIYNRNHIKHFRTLPWWFKSNVLTEYKVLFNEFNLNENGKEKENATDNEPIVKKRKTYKHTEDTCKNNTSMELEPLASFCDNTQSQVMDVHNTSKEIEYRLELHQHQSSLLEEKIKNALFSDTELNN